MYQASGGCYCKNITLKIKVIKNFNLYKPRICNCNFCSKHGVAYISDPKGTLKITVNNKNSLKKYKVGSGLADFLICKECGVFVSVCYKEKGCIYGSINSKTIDDNVHFGSNMIISPKQLDDTERIKKWKSAWFTHVEFLEGS